MNSVVHFELPYAEKERVMKFYADTFGWKLNDMPEMQYTIAHTTETDKQNMPEKPGAINGGLMKRDGIFKGPSITIHTDSVDAALEKVKENGGTVAMPKTTVGDMGYIAYIKDTEENIIGVWEDQKK